MKQHFPLGNLIRMAIPTILFLALIFIRPTLAAQDSWPKRFDDPKGTVVMYQPQLEDFKDDKLTARAAVSVKTKAMQAPVFGAIWLTGRVRTDRDTRMATIDEVKVTDARFPDAKPEQLEKLTAFLNTEMAGWSIPIALDRLLAALEVVEQEKAGDHGLKNDPPKIIFRSHPAVLVLLDGDPKLLPIPQSSLMRVVNTPFLMLYDPPAKSYYLKGGADWLAATDLKGPWKDLEQVPETIKTLEAAGRKTSQGKGAPKKEEAKTSTMPAEPLATDGEPTISPIRGTTHPSPSNTTSTIFQDLENVPKATSSPEAAAQETAQSKGAPKKVEAKAGKMPEVIVSTGPAELLVTDGEPTYTPIRGTNLLYISNTMSTIFMDTSTQEYYALISGRWFKTRALADGSWTYVASNQLPKDFANIPENSTKGFVLANVADTQQAKEAVLDNSIPQTATIDRKKATTKVEYAGEPKFEPIPGTDLQYAVNTGQTVFKEGTTYYAVNQGVWYEADSPNGPWQVTTTPPRQVDKIPVSNPHYNAKYVKVYDSTEDTVTVGYTPGYTGSYVDNGTVVYGTGYTYPGYASAEAYIPSQATYGYGAVYDPYVSSWGYQTPYYNPGSWLATGLTAAAVGVGAAAIASNWWDRGNVSYGGGYWGPGGYNNFYHPGGPPPPGMRPPGPPPGVQGPPGGKPGAGPGHPATLPANRPNLYNRPGNENRLAARPGRPAAMPVSGVAPGHPGPGSGKPSGAIPGKPAQVAKPKPEARPAPAAKPTQPKVRPAGGPNNVLADKNGTVYKRDKQGNFQQRQGNQWKPAATPTTRPATASRPERPAAAPRPSFDPSQLNRDAAARHRGEVRTQNFQRASAAPRPQVGPPRGGGPRPGPAIRPAGGGGRGGGGGGRGGRR
jgi:hypothetical protein